LKPSFLRYVAAFAGSLVAGVAGVAGAGVPGWLAPITQTAEPFIGVTHYQITQSLGSPTPSILPREVSIHIVEIDPTAPGISFFGTPGNGVAPEEYTRQTTSSFVYSHSLAVAVNGDFYTTDTGGEANVSGLGMSNGEIVSAAVNGRPSFVVRQDNSALVRTNGTIPFGAYNAVSGNQRLILDGANVTPLGDSYTTALNPHTAIGVNDANGHIFLMTVDGRQADFSEGMRTDEMADILIDFGVDQAINLDGGGSTTLVFADGADGAPRTVNSPSDSSTSKQPGFERSVANHFGLYATPNPDYTPLPAPPRAPDPVLAQLTILDGFDGDEGHFTWAPFASSGSTNGITEASLADYVESDAHAGVGSQQITLVRDESALSRFRHVSGGGKPQNNRVLIGRDYHSLGPQGFVGFFLKTTEADLTVAIGIDDGIAESNTGLESSVTLPVIADGKWHLYEWDLADADQWENFSLGNGTIDGPNAYVDSLFFYSGPSTAGKTFTMSLDTVAYNPQGSLASLAATGAPGDFDLNVAINAVDLAKWKGDFGANGFSDADADGDSDGADFLVWQRQVEIAAEPENAAIPEPSSGLLALLAVVIGLSQRSRDRATSMFRAS
jgi:hypothetical protein